VAIAKTAGILYSIDAKASLFTVHALASGMVAVVAHSPKFAIRGLHGAANFVPGSTDDSSLELAIKLNSLDIMDEVSAAERREIEKVMFNEVLECDRYPIAEFKSTLVTSTKNGENMYRMIVFGDLTLHGITRGLKFESTVMIGEETLKAQGSFSLLQTDFGLKIASVAGGSLKLKDELKCTFFIIAKRVKDAASR
jgi:polyisoprenoid-binding protein YceI